MIAMIIKKNNSVIRRRLESPLDCKEIKPVNPKGKQSWIFIGRTDAEAEAPILWPPEAKNWLFGKDPDAGKNWRQEERRRTEDKIVGWRHQLDGDEFEQALGVGDGQGSLVCCSPWHHKESDTTETELKWYWLEGLHFLPLWLWSTKLLNRSEPQFYVNISKWDFYRSYALGLFWGHIAVMQTKCLA